MEATATSGSGGARNTPLPPNPPPPLPHRTSAREIKFPITYYYDHQAAMDEQIERDFKEYVALREANANSPIRARLHRVEPSTRERTHE
jgi:hypothetical protein